MATVHDVLENARVMLDAAATIDRELGSTEWQTMPYDDYMRFAAEGEQALVKALRGYTDLCRSMGLEIGDEAKQ